MFATQIPSLITHDHKFCISTSKWWFTPVSSPGSQVHQSSVLRTVLQRNMYPNTPSSSLALIYDPKSRLRQTITASVTLLVVIPWPPLSVRSRWYPSSFSLWSTFLHLVSCFCKYCLVVSQACFCFSAAIWSCLEARCKASHDANSWAFRVKLCSWASIWSEMIMKHSPQTIQLVTFFYVMPIMWSLSHC